MVFTTRIYRDSFLGMYVGRLRAFLALGNLVFHDLTVIKRSKALGRNIRMMNEQFIAAIVRNNKTVPLPVVKPFYLTFIHSIVSLGFEHVTACNVISLANLIRGTLRGKRAHSKTQ